MRSQAPMAERPVVLPPQTEGVRPLMHIESSLNYPLDIRREIDRKWQRRGTESVSRDRASRTEPPGCPLCHAPAPIAPAGSSYRGGGLIHHQWLCEPCGHVWTTPVRMPR
jgi:hypothetical protein